MATAIPKAYLASAAIRCRDVETDPTAVCWPSFPPPVPPAGAPFPPRGLVGSIPPLRRCRVGGGAHRRARLRPPLKRYVRFSRIPLSQGCPGAERWKVLTSGPSALLWDGASPRVSSADRFWVFHIRNLSAPSALLTPVLPSLPPPCRPTSPAHPAAALAVERLSPPVRYYSVVRLLARHRLPLRRQTYRSAYLGASRGPCEASWGHVWFFRTVPSAHTLMRWVDGNAFAPIVRARPCPIFGRPVHHGIAPSITARYCSSYPSDSTSRWTPCPPPRNPHATASEALPPLLDTVLSIRAPEGLEPS